MLRSMAAAFAVARRRPWRSMWVAGRLDRVQYRWLLAGFAVLGGHVGVWAVLLADLTQAHAISPGVLGQVLAGMSVLGALSSFVGGRVLDRLGRRLLLVLGMAGVGGVFVAVGLAGSRDMVIASFLVMGCVGGFFDLSLNSLGSDFERTYEKTVMTSLHAGFSAGAAATALLTGIALAAGLGYSTIYVTYGVAMVAVAAMIGIAPLPSHRATAGAAIPTGARPGRLWSRGLVVAMLLIALTFMQDAVIEGFSAIYLQATLGAGPLLLGGGIAVTHVAVLTGRLISTGTVRRLGERGVLTMAGLGAALGLGLVVMADRPGGAVVGFLLIGVAVAPVAPLAISLAGRSAPERAGEAVAAVSIVAYGAFFAGPLLAGALADTASLRLALLPFVVTSLLMALVAAVGLRRQSSVP